MYKRIINGRYSTFLLIFFVITAAITWLRFYKNDLLESEVDPFKQSKLSPTPFDKRRAREDFLKTSEPFTIVNSDYSGWKTYTNKVLNYTLKYPGDWELNDSNASVDKFNSDGTCCNSSTLSITNGAVLWEMNLNGLYTGGAGLDQAAFFDQCQPLENSPCKFYYEGPINIGNVVAKEVYKRQLVNEKTGQIIVSTVGEVPQEYNWGVLPVFSFREVNEEVADIESYGSIDYRGDNLNADIPILDKITSSIRFY